MISIRCICYIQEKKKKLELTNIIVEDLLFLFSLILHSFGEFVLPLMISWVKLVNSERSLPYIMRDKSFLPNGGFILRFGEKSEGLFKRVKILNAESMFPKCRSVTISI